MRSEVATYVPILLHYLMQGWQSDVDALLVRFCTSQMHPAKFEAAAVSNV